MIKAIAELLALILGLVEKGVSKNERKKQKQKIEDIRNDPLTEWDRKFKRVRKPARKEEKLSSDNSRSTGEQ